MGAELRCTDPAHRSYSDDKAWDGCQWLAHARRDLGIPYVGSAKIARGSTVDEIAMAMIEGCDPPPIEATFRRYAAEYNVQSFDEKDIAAAQAQVDLFEREVLPSLPPVWATQHEGHFSLDGIVYHYHADIIYQDGAIDDLKAPDARLGIDRAATDPQLTTYAYGLWAEFGHETPRVGLIGLINAKEPEDVQPDRKLARKPWVERQSSIRTRAQLEAWADDARRREAARRWAYLTGIYQTQARMTTYECNGCAAKAICPSWAGWDLATIVRTEEAVTPRQDWHMHYGLRCWASHGRSDGVTLTNEEIKLCGRMSPNILSGAQRSTKGGLYGDANDYFGKDYERQLDD